MVFNAAEAGGEALSHAAQGVFGVYFKLPGDIDQREQDKPGVLRYVADDPVKMPFAAHHRPEMFDRFNTVEMDECGLCNRLKRFSGRIGNEVEMEPLHRIFTDVDNIVGFASGKRCTRARPRSVPDEPRFVHRAGHMTQAFLPTCG